MDWASFGKRLIISIIVCVIITLIATFLVFHVLTLANFFLVLVFLGVILLVFGACSQTPFIEAMATLRYAVNPQVTRDTARHYSERRDAQTRSGVIILLTGAILLVIGLVGLFILPFLPA
jgi:hypothetical protein